MTNKVQHMIGWIFYVAMIMNIVGCEASGVDAHILSGSESVKVSDLKIVDCLLPGYVNRIGGVSYVSMREPARTTAFDCNIRGGEYVAHDLADYRSALNVWLAKAERGDAEAQTYVGEIFEKGLGQTIDYASAVSWYSKAAEQGYKRALINLGFLYEKGLGVEQDIGRALSYYRAATGEERLVLSSHAKGELDRVRREVQETLDIKEKETLYYRKQLDRLSDKIEDGTILSRQKDEEINLLTSLYQKSQIEVAKLSSKIAAFPVVNYRNIPSTKIVAPKKTGSSLPSAFNNMNFGRYFALIIGNQNYQFLDDLNSPRRDAMRLKSVLEERYGFSTITLIDANENEILNAFDELFHQIGPKDNLLVFYAGHGDLSMSDNLKRRRGYWLPANAELQGLNNWISNSVVSDHLDRIKARSVLVIADSCFAGNLASEKSAFLLGSIDTDLTKKSINMGLARRARIVISSGGEKPVLDGRTGEHSIFATALIELLEKNDGVLRDDMLFSHVSVDVRQRSTYSSLEQIPEMRPIRAAGHEGGDFFFVPQLSESAIVRSL